VDEQGRAVVSARLWDAPLRRKGSERFGVGKEGALTLDPVSLGPGHHPMQLLGMEAGMILLDCVGISRTGDWKPRSPDSRPERFVELPGDQAFLGVQLGALRQGGVAIDRIYPGTAAAENGLEAGDIILELGGDATVTVALLQNAIGSHQPGDVVDLVPLRAGKRSTQHLRLGTRPGDRVLRSEEAQEVLEVLQLRAGQSVADLGCGSGWLSEAMAGKLAGSATVYAVEIQGRHIIEQYARAVPGGIPVLSLPDDVSLPENSVELAVLHDVASHIDSEARPSFYDSVRLALRPGGRLAVFGPHGEAEEMLRVLRSNGFVALEEDALSKLSPAELDARLGEGILFRPR